MHGQFKIKQLIPIALLLMNSYSYADAEAGEKQYEVYGFAQADYVQDFRRIEANWADTLRPSKIPTQSGELGSDGQATIGVRQSRFGVNANLPAGKHDIKTKFEFDMFGVGPDEGVTTIRLRHAYGHWGRWTAGQTHSLYMDIDAFPNVIDYWGPNGIVFLRTPQIRYEILQGDDYLAVAIEKADDDIDPGDLRQTSPDFADEVQADQKIPDITARYRMNRDWGHLHFGGILRNIGYETRGTATNSPKGSLYGYGLDISSNLKMPNSDVLAVSTNFGKGIASYQNDGGTDLGPTGSVGNARAKLLPLWGISAFYNHYWNERYTSSLGYARVSVQNTRLQSGDAFQQAEYASTNLLYKPVKNVMVGGELLWGSRTDKDNAYGNDIRTQISFKYSFSSLDF